jgi:hypothetical protein
MKNGRTWTLNFPPFAVVSRSIWKIAQSPESRWGHEQAISLIGFDRFILRMTLIDPFN